MRDSNGNAVFVKDDGSYSQNFPEENIVDRPIAHNEYVVYFFVSVGESHKELSYRTKEKQEALDFATNVYGQELEVTENVSGEVFEVEVHYT